MMRLRSHLQILTVGTLLPMVAFGLAATVIIADRERDLMLRGGTERTLALLTAVDAKLDGYLESLGALGGSSALSRDDLAAFHAEAQRALLLQPGWQGVQLARPNREVVLDAVHPFGSDLESVGERPSFDAAVTERRATIRNLYPEADGGQVFGVRLPVMRGDAARYVLSAFVDPLEMYVLLERQRLPVDWVGVVLDANHRIVARTIDNDANVGRLASVSLRNALTREPEEGWFRGATLEGAEVYTPYTRSLRSGWTVAIGIPAAQVDTGAATVAWIFAAGVALALIAAVVLANRLSRRIQRPMAALASTARAIGRGEPVEPLTSAGVREIQEVSYVLGRAAKNVREREAALRAADRAKDEFLAMLGHELRNPLSALTSAADILHLSGSHGDGPPIRAAVVIDRQVRHMTRLVDDLLDVSRVTTGKVHLELAPLDLGATVQSVLDTFEAGDRLSDHELVTDIVPVWVRADRSRIEQVFSNLLDNALKYTPAGGRITVRVGGVSEERGEAVLQVEDSGTGMSEDLASRAFETFVQGDSSLDREAGGLGLGLTLVKSLVESHGGTVDAYSDGPGRGALFTVTLPTIEPPASVPEDDKWDATDAVHPRSGHRVLIIEDNEDAREALTVALEFFGHDVLTAADGEVGLELVRRERPDLAVIDIGLPRMDGFEVARRLRSSNGLDIRLVALTGYSQNEASTRAEAAGFDRALTKPVGIKDLARIIEELLAESPPS